jgi:hypothetical protein
MNELEQAKHELKVAVRLLLNVRREHKLGRATVFAIERAMIALENAQRKSDEALEALLKELGA